MPAGLLETIDRPSSNFGDRKGDRPVDTLVLHYTDTQSAADALAILTDPAKQVSAHYLLDEDGTVYHLVDEEYRAWHAGLSYWRGDRDVNSRSIGIEIQNPGERFGYRVFPDVQMQALVLLVRGIMARWPIEQRNVIGHSDVACDRKHDPGHLFDWRWLASQGIGLWPEPVAAEPEVLSDLLADLGYDPGCECAVEAFQRHYRPARVDNRADAETAGLAAGLLRRIAHAST